MTDKQKKAESTIKTIRSYYLYSMLGIALLSIIILIGYGAVQNDIKIPENVGLMGKSILIIIFLISIPVVVSLFNKQLRRIPLEWRQEKQFRRYRFFYNIKILVLIIVSILSLLVFILTGDFEMLIFLFATLLFLYFDRPTFEKIHSDLRISKECSEDNQDE